MSGPAWRTASSEEEKRRQSPSSARIAVALTGPTPYRRSISARQPGLAAGKSAQSLVERRQFEIEHLEHAQAERDELPPGRRELRPSQRLPAGFRAQSQPGWHALVE